MVPPQRHILDNNYLYLISFLSCNWFHFLLNN